MRLNSCDIHDGTVVAYTGYTCPLCEALESLKEAGEVIEQLESDIIETKEILMDMGR